MQNSSRSHFEGTDIWSTGDPRVAAGHRLARAVSRHAARRRSIRSRRGRPSATIPRTLQANRSACRRFPAISGVRVREPEHGAAEAAFARDSATRIASHLPVDQPHLAFVNATAQAAFATLDRVAQVGTYAPTVTYPNNGFALALRTIAGAMVKGVGTQGVLGADRRVRHARGAEHEPGERFLHRR